ncbi:MAG: hypothetical protein WC307_05155 [Candidatus Nanoarchaeia archaeon]|jgi:hypothetical protein
MKDDRINYKWLNESFKIKIKRFFFMIKTIPLLLSNDFLCVKRKNWMTNKQWDKNRKLIYKVTRQVINESLKELEKKERMKKK